MVTYLKKRQRSEARGEIRGKIALYVSMKYNISEEFIKNELYPIKSVEELSFLYHNKRIFFNFRRNLRNDFKIKTKIH